MATDNYNSNINVNVNTGQSLAELRRLQAALSHFHQQIAKGNASAAVSQEALNAKLLQQINAIKGLSAAQAKIAGTTDAFTNALERNKLTLREYARYSAAGFLEGSLGKALSKRSSLIREAFAQERKVLTRAYQDRVKLLQSQWIRTGRAGMGPEVGIRVTPTTLSNMDDFATKTQLAAQRMQLLNATVKQGATQLINWGKNTQWAGRQLMVGLTVPLMMLAGVAAKTFKEMEMATLRFRRVYGDLFTDDQDTNAAVENVRRLAIEYTKFGLTVVDTMTMAADAAAAGFSGKALLAQVEQANKLAALGQVEQQQALETTISLQNAFQISTENLAGTIDFLNAVENQTVVSIEDLTIAIPKAAPVVRQLGGDVKDLAFFLTAMKEGGINASEGANALKSGLASLINPTDKASEMLAGFGINIKGIIEANKGNLKATVVGFAQALDTLDPLNRARAIEQLFGKFQFSRLSTLFTNVAKEGTQAARVFDLMSASTEELAIMSRRELGKVEESVSVQFQKALEEVKQTLLPIGKLFLESMIPVLKFVGNIIERFNDLGDGTKRFILVFAAGFPALLMTLGLFGNLVGNVVKGVWGLNMILAKARGSSNVLGATFNYLTTEELENLSMTAALNTGHTKLIEVFNVEASAVSRLTAAYQANANAARAMAAANPGFFVGGKAGAKGAVSKLPKKLNRGTANVQYYAKGTDTVPAMLTPGEAVIPAEQAQNPQNKPFIQAMLKGKEVQGFAGGDDDVKQSSRSGGGLTPAQRAQNRSALSYYTKNPNRVAGGIKAAETRKLRALEAEAKAAEASAKEKESQTKKEKLASDKKIAAEKKREKIGKFAGRASGALGVASMAAFATGNTGVGMGLMGASMAASLAPALANPYVAAGAAVVAMGASIYALNKVLEGRARAEEKFVRSITANTEQMAKIGEITGKIGASEIMAERRIRGTGQTYNEAQRVGREFGSQFLSSDIGKELYKAFNTNRDIYGTERAAQQFAIQLAAYVSDGIMTAEQANSIGEQIAVNLGNATVKTKIQGELLMLVGPNGEDLFRDPLQTRINLIQRSGRQARRLSRDEGFQSLAEQAKQQDTWYQTESTVRLRAGAAQMAGYAAQATEFAQAQLDALTVYYEKQQQSLETALKQTTDLKQRAEIEQRLLVLKRQQQAGEVALQQEVAKTLDRSFKQFKKLQETKDAFGFGFSTAQEKKEDAYFDALKGKILDIYKGTEFETASKDLLGRLAKLSDENIGFLDEYNKAGFATATQAQDFEVKMQLLLANKQANPDQIVSFMSMFSGKQLAKGAAALDLSIRTKGAAKTFELQSILATMGTGKKAQSIAQEVFIKVTQLNPTEFDKTLKALAVLETLDGYEINMQFLLSDKSKFNLTDYANDLAKIEDMPDVTEKTVRTTLQQIGMDENGIQGLMKDWETYYSKMPDDVRKEAIQKYATFYTFQTEFKDNAAKLEWINNYAKKRTEQILAENKGKVPLTYDTVFRFQVQNLTGMSDKDLSALRAGEQTQTFFGPINNIDPNVPGDGTGDGTRAGKDSALDDLLKRLKFVRDAAINAQGGVKELMRITKGEGIKKFAGVSQQLLMGLGGGGKGGFNREFIDMLESMDNKTRKTFMTVKKGKVILTEQGKALKEAFNEKAIGEFQNAQIKSIQDTKAQNAAFARLKALGVDTATALDMVADANLAVAINSKNITSKELVNMAKNAALAKDELASLNLELNKTVEELKKEEEQLMKQATVAKAIKNIRPNIDTDVLKNILSNDTLVKSFYEKIVSGATDYDTELIDAINSILKKGKYQVEIDALLSPDGLKSFQDAFQKAADQMEKYFAGKIASIQNEIAIGRGFEGFNSMMNSIDTEIANAQSGVVAAQRGLEVFENQINNYQNEIQRIRDRVSQEYDVKIERLKNQIEKEQERIADVYDPLIDALSKESAGLNNDLAIMNHAAEEINKKYDEQAKALERIQSLNQDIIAQQKQQLNIADAITSGDISAAAQAVQDYRAQQAATSATAATDALENARQLEIDNLRNEAGLTQEEIQLRLYQISQETYKLESDRQKELDALIPKQKQIEELERKRRDALIQILDYEQKISDIINSQAYLDAKKALEDAEKALADAEKKKADIEEALRRALADVDKQKASWEDIKAGIVIAEGAVIDYEKALTDAKTAAGNLAAEIKKIAEAEKLLNAPVEDTGEAIVGGLDPAAASKAAADAALADAQALEKESANALENSTKSKSNIPADDAHKGIMARAAAAARANAGSAVATGNASGVSKSSGGGGGKTTAAQLMAKSLNAAKDAAKVLEGLMKKIADYSKLAADENVKIRDAIKMQLDYVTAIEPIEKRIVDSNRTKLDLVTKIKGVFDSIVNVMTGVMSATSQYINLLSSAASVARSILSSIMALNTTVTTTHIINTIYTTSGSPTGTATPGAFGGLAKTLKYGGKVGYFVNGSNDPIFKPVGSDTVPAMLNPDEFVMNPGATKAFLPMLRTMNNFTYPQMSKDSLFPSMNQSSFVFSNPSMSDYNISSPVTDYQINAASQPTSIVNSSPSVYNYSLSVNVEGSNSNANDIANVVMAKLKTMDKYNIRGQRV